MTKPFIASQTVRPILASTALALVLAASWRDVASAQDAIPDAPAPAAVDPSEEAEDRAVITVYGTSNPMPVFEYPGQVTVVTREAIETFAPSAMSDLLRDAPGVEFSGGPRRTGETPSIRGLGGENVLILLDGARQSFISAHDGRFFLDPDLIKTAEVVRGPASALYGSGAVGGVLAFETVDAADLLAPGQSLGARLRLGYQDVNGESLASATAFARSGGLDVLGAIGVRRSGDITLGSGAELPSDDDIETALLKAGSAFGAGFDLEASWQRFANSAIEPNNGQGTLGTGDALLDRDVEKDATTDLWRATLGFDPSSALIDAQMTLYRSSTAVEEFDPTTGRTSLRDIDTTGVSVRNAAAFAIGTGFEGVVTLGADWYEDEQAGRDSASNDGSRAGVPDGASRFVGVFAQAEAEIDRPLGLPGDLVIVPSVRFDAFTSESTLSPEESSKEEVSPRFAASYGPVSWFRVFGSYSEGFRAPSINELYLTGVHFPVPHPTLFNPRAGRFVFANNNFVPNPDLLPEVSDTVEFGLAFDFKGIATSNDRLSGKVSRHDSAIEDLINLSVNFAFDPTCFAPPTFQPCTAGTTTSANVDAADLEGVEAEIAYDADRLYGRLTFATIEGVDTLTGADVGALTPDRLALDLGVKLPAVRARVGARLQFAGDFERRALDAGGNLVVVESRDGYAVADLYGTWRPSFAPNLRLDASIENLFDEDYERVFAGVSEPGRNVKIAATYQFGR